MATATIASVLKAMIIRPKYLQIVNATSTKVYKLTGDNLAHYQEYFARNNSVVKTLNFNRHTQILKVTI